METLDAVFLVVFARYRRKVGDSKLTSAWVRASYTVSAYVSWPVAAATLVLVMITYTVSRTGTPMDHRRLGQITAVMMWLVIAFLLDRRFSFLPNCKVYAA